MQQNTIHSTTLKQNPLSIASMQRVHIYRQWAQIMVITRYEFKMQWRRRALLVITLAMLLIAVTPTIVLRHELDTDTELAKATGTISASTLVSFIFIPVGTILAMIVPFIMADVVPKDQQLGVRDLLNSTPLSAGPYLMGKLLGSWLSVSASVLAVIIPAGVLWYGLIGPFELDNYIEPWIVGALPMIIINTGLAVLLTATQPDPRRAIPIIVAVFVLLPAILGFDPAGDWRDAFNPLRPGLFFNFTDTLKPEPENMSLGAGNPSITLISVEATIISGLAQLAVVWFVLWRWLRRQMG